MKNVIVILGVTAGVILLGTGVYLMRPPVQASAPIEATPVLAQELAGTTQTPIPEAKEASTGDPVEIATPTALPIADSGVSVFVISQDESQVSFSLDEILRGNPFRPVGTTNQVAGEVAVDFTQGSVTMGTVQVNARTLRTDSGMRDRMIQNEILDTASYEKITFEPTAITGLPKTVEIGQEVNFQIKGNLTIRDVTKEVTFDAKVKLVSLERLEGYASTTVLRSDFQLEIPQVPSVAGVSDEVLLEISFVALKK